jgi:hypothetical protein
LDSIFLPPSAKVQASLKPQLWKLRLKRSSIWPDTYSKCSILLSFWA